MMKTILIIALVALSVACDSTLPEPELAPAHVRVCVMESYHGTPPEGECVGLGYWGNERAPTISGTPLANVPIRLCDFRDLFVCRDRTGGTLRVSRTDDEGYAVLFGLPVGNYAFFSEVDEVEIDNCVYTPYDRYGGVLRVDERIASTPIEYQNAHIGELWFVKRCDNSVFG